MSAIKAKIKAGKKMDEAAFEVIREAIKETKAIRFEGNGYSEEWVKEAAKRGLLNLRKTPEALAELVTPKAKAVLSKRHLLRSGSDVSFPCQA